MKSSTKRRGLLLEKFQECIRLSATIDLPDEDFINEDFQFSIAFDNTSGSASDVDLGPLRIRVRVCWRVRLRGSCRHNRVLWAFIFTRRWSAGSDICLPPTNCQGGCLPGIMTRLPPVTR